MNPNNADLIHFGVVALVLVGQAILALRAWSLARSGYSTQLNKMAGQFSTDIVERSRRGDGPDWLRYRNEVDRVYEGRDETLRSLAAAALALGLGGTILALVLSILLSNPNNAVSAGAPFSASDPESNQSPAPIELILGMGISLVGSLLGVVNNLYIVLRALWVAESGFNKASKQVFENLQGIADQNRPKDMFGRALRDEIAGLLQTLNNELASAFSQAMSDFPGVVQSLGLQINDLAATVKEQGDSISHTVGELRECSIQVAESSQRLQPAALQLAQATGSILKLPKDLEQVLDSGRQAWLEGIQTREQQALQASRDLQDAVLQVGQAVQQIPTLLQSFFASGRQLWIEQLREEHKAARQELILLLEKIEESSKARELKMNEMVRELQSLVGDVKTAVHQIPELLAQQVGAAADTMGIEFGREAKAHVNELEGRLERIYGELGEKVAKHEAEWRNNIGSVVEELFRRFSGEVQTQLVGKLQDVNSNISESTQLLSKVATDMSDAHEDWAKTQATSLQGWQEASSRIESGAAKLAQTEGVLHASADALGQSAAEIERVARLSDDLDQRLISSLRQVAERYLNDLEPLHRDLGGLMYQLQAEYGAILDKQATIIRKAIEMILRRETASVIRADHESA